MNSIINKYLLISYFKIFINTILIFFSLGVLINLFEEIEFFKNLDQSLILPLLLSLSVVPSFIFDLLPFIIFLSAVFYFIKIRTNKNLLSFKIFGYSNLKLIFILSAFSLILGILFLILINPITSSLIKSYEITKAKYSRDVDHLVSINKNGLWIKEYNKNNFLIIHGENLKAENLLGVSIYEFDLQNRMISRINADSADISQSPWKLKNVTINNFENGNYDVSDNLEFNTNRTYSDINTLYKNLNTISFLELIKNYNLLLDKGYSKKILNEQIHKFLSLPINLFLMIVLASIFTIGTLNNKANYFYLIVSILICVIIYYFKDLSSALGQTGKISITLSIWMPLILIGLFCSIGIIQINEK